MKKKIRVSIIAVLCALFVLAIIIVPIAIYRDLCNFSSSHETFRFDDGSKVIQQGGPTYVHLLFDDYALDCGDELFSQRFFIDTNDTIPLYNTMDISETGYYLKYAFDPAGYIAYYRLTGLRPSEDVTEEYLYEKHISGRDYLITSENAVLYNCEADTETLFDSVNELCAYCDKNNISLGTWYYSAFFGSIPEEEIVEFSTGYSIVKTPKDYYIVKNGKQEMFMGDIDRYAVNGKYFAFHLRIKELSNDVGFVNPNINYDINSPVDSEFEGILYGKVNVYADKYVIIDTESGSFDVIDASGGNREIKAYAKDHGIEFDWIKLKNK